MLNTSDSFYFHTSEEAESAFYSAFEMGDIDLMTALMADINVTCIHPNSMPIIGRDEVLASWKSILSNLDEPAFYPEVLHRAVEGNEIGNTAIHLVAERIAPDHKIDSEKTLVLATNVYIKQENGWRMILHHSSLPPHLEDHDLENDPSITHSAPQTMQ